MVVLILTQAGCDFCDRAKSLLDRLAVEFDLQITEQSLADAAGRALGERLGVLFAPGIVVDGELVAYGRPSERRLRRELGRRASARSSRDSRRSARDSHRSDVEPLKERSKP